MITADKIMDWTPPTGPGPVYEAMKGWLDGEPVSSLAEFHARFGGHFRNYCRHWDDEIDGSDDDMRRRLDASVQRAMWIGAYGFTLPCAELIAACVKNSPLIEIGAGSGALARLIANAGGEIVATDLGSAQHGFEIGRWFPVQTGVDARAAVKAHPNATVLCSWPSLKEDWFHRALRAMHRDQAVIVVREDACADDKTWTYFDGPRFADIGTIEIPCWPNMHDIAEGRRKR